MGGLVSGCAAYVAGASAQDNASAQQWRNRTCRIFVMASPESVLVGCADCRRSLEGLHVCRSSLHDDPHVSHTAFSQHTCSDETVAIATVDEGPAIGLPRLESRPEVSIAGRHAPRCDLKVGLRGRWTSQAALQTLLPK